MKAICNGAKSDDVTDEWAHHSGRGPRHTQPHPQTHWALANRPGSFVNLLSHASLHSRGHRFDSWLTLIKLDFRWIAWFRYDLYTNNDKKFSLLIIQKDDELDSPVVSALGV
jgi:hypothetical protein